jgi:hypothetical protein
LEILFKEKEMPHKSPKTAQEWIEAIFAAKAARSGGIVRRSLRSVLRYASLDALRAEVIRRKFHMIINNDQVVVFCNGGSISIIA